MANLSRIAMKIFGNLSGVNQISKFGSYFAGSPQFTTDPGEAMSLSNWDEGWYSASIGGNKPAQQDINAVDFVFSYQLAYLLQKGIPGYSATTEYFTGDFVNDSGTLYVSAADNNIGNALSNTAYWRAYGSDPVGTVKAYCGSVLPSGGYVWASGKTIGSASSGATERANADTLGLYTLLWNSTSNSDLTIQTSAGAPTVRGASAAADFSANKRLPVIDLRGSVPAAIDNLGGTSANRLTTTTMARPNGIGCNGGSQTHTLVTGEMPSHTHTQNSHNHTQNAHTHTQNSHNHTQNAHTHAQNAHYHNLEIVNNTSASTTIPTLTNSLAGGNGNQTSSLQFVNQTTATNQNTTATNNAATATNQNTTATNNAATATNQNTGGGGAHNNVQPTTLLSYIIKL